MTTRATTTPEARGADLSERFAQLALRPGGPPRKVAIQRAHAELERLKPELSQLIRGGCHDLEVALLAASRNESNRGQHIGEAYGIAESLRDVAGSLGFAFIGLIASNLCTIFETVTEAGLPYPFNVLDCHIQALRFAQGDSGQETMTADCQKLAAALSETVQLVKNVAAAAAPRPDAADQVH